MTKKIEDEIIDVFPWHEGFETGIDEIDNQHKQLISLLNKLADSLTQDESFEVEDTFKELGNYAMYHFESEELIWNEYIKSDLLTNNHKEFHASFLPKVQEIKESNKDKSIYVIAEEILLFLIRWLAFHIIDEDKRLALIIKSLNQGKNLSEAQFISDSMMSGSMRTLIEAILSMYDNLSLKAIKLIRERKERIKAQKELKSINKKLEELSITDQLTGLFNRRHFENIFNIELKKAKRNKSVFSVVLFDIDFFKKLNDTYGHNAGDNALILLSETVKDICKRPNDFVFRIGGEEFCILIANEELDTAEKLAKILKEKIHKLKIPNKNSSVSEYLTISAGVISLIPEDETMTSIMNIVDERLYCAKKLGRNSIFS